MSAAWDWPGSRWWRLDLHAHSPASHDFGSQADRDHPDWVAWITAARDAGLHAIAITDHNTASGIEPLQQAASQVQDSPVLFPGVEVTASDEEGDTTDPNVHAASAIERITVQRAKYLGRSDPLTVRFNPWFNTIIGGRGTGKSTLIDFCRTALRRESELDGHDELYRAFQQRLRVPRERGDEGLLTDATTLQVIYRKDGARFALSWKHDGSVPSIARCDGEVLVPEDGDIRERFPVRIYSQKQLFEVARNPDALLAVIDDTEAVDGAGQRRRSSELAARYLALRAEARALRAEAADLPARNATLSDARRKLHLLQTGKHASALKEYGKVRRQDGAWQSIRRKVMDEVADIGREVDDLAVADLEQEVENSGDPAGAALRSANEELGQIVRSLKDAVREAIATAEQGIRRLGSEPDDAWNQAVEASAAEYKKVSSQLEAAGISNPGEYRDLLDQQATLKQETEHLEAQRDAAQEREETAASILKEYRSVRADLSSRREQFADQTSSELVRIRIDAAGDRSDLPEFLRKTLGIEHFDQDHGALAEKIDPRPKKAWTYCSLDSTVAELHQFIAGTGSWDAKDARFERPLKGLQPEQLDRLALYVAGDSVTVSFRDQRQPGKPWKPLAQGSPGQQTAALLAFVLGYGVEPIILDQPEDDLDNALIYELLVRRLREQKAQRQIIVVTHNPNIVVHGDAELAMSLDTKNGEAEVVCAGGLQERTVRDEICRVMEGGREAFQARYRRIMPTDESN